MPRPSSRIAIWASPLLGRAAPEIHTDSEWLCSSTLRINSVNATVNICSVAESSFSALASDRAISSTCPLRTGSRLPASRYNCAQDNRVTGRKGVAGVVHVGGKSAERLSQSLAADAYACQGLDWSMCASAIVGLLESESCLLRNCLIADPMTSIPKGSRCWISRQLITYSRASGSANNSADVSRHCFSPNEAGRAYSWDSNSRRTTHPPALPSPPGSVMDQGSRYLSRSAWVSVPPGPEPNDFPSGPVLTGWPTTVSIASWRTVLPWA